MGIPTPASREELLLAKVQLLISAGVDRYNLKHAKSGVQQSVDDFILALDVADSQPVFNSLVTETFSRKRRTDGAESRAKPNPASTRPFQLAQRLDIEDDSISARYRYGMTAPTLDFNGSSSFQTAEDDSDNDDLDSPGVSEAIPASSARGAVPSRGSLGRSTRQIIILPGTSRVPPPGPPVESRYREVLGPDECLEDGRSVPARSGEAVGWQRPFSSTNYYTATLSDDDEYI